MWSTLQGRFPLRGEDLEWCEHQEHLEHSSSGQQLRPVQTPPHCLQEGRGTQPPALPGQEPPLPPCHAPHLTHLLSWHSSGGHSCLCHSCARCSSWGQEGAFQCSGGQDSCPPPPEEGASRSAAPPILPTPPPHPTPLSEARTHSGAEPVSSSVQTRSQVMCKRRTGVRCGSCAAGTGHLGRQSHPWDMDPQNELWGQPKGLWEPCLLSLSTCR